MTKITVKELERRVGGLSDPSKMPGLAYGIPAEECAVGAILRKISGSVCHDCYAFKGNYIRYPNVALAQTRRLAAILADTAAWTENMVELLRRKYHNKPESEKFFRWHDSGDIQNDEHLSAIVEIAERLPDVKFWIPTKEYALIRTWSRSSSFPPNLVVRVSAPMIGQKPAPIAGTAASTVGRDSAEAHTCPAPKQDNNCGDCRACWDIDVPIVDYIQH